MCFVPLLAVLYKLILICTDTGAVVHMMILISDTYFWDKYKDVLPVLTSSHFTFMFIYAIKIIATKNVHLTLKN